jgi:CBS domain-containing protein
VIARSFLEIAMQGAQHPLVLRSRPHGRFSAAGRATGSIGDDAALGRDSAGSPAEEAHMQVRHILRDKGREVVTIFSDATLSEASRLLASKRIGAVVVRDRDGGLAGMLSERDIVRALAEASVNALPQTVSKYMTRTVATCSETDSVDEIMEVMTNGRFRHVPVVDNERITGIVSIGDVVKTRIAETVQEAQSLREYIAAG